LAPTTPFVLVHSKAPQRGGEKTALQAVQDCIRTTRLLAFSPKVSN